MPIALIVQALASFAPLVAKYFGKGEEVAGAIGDIAMQVAGAKTPEEALDAIKANTQLQTDFKLKVMENETHLDEIYLEDMQNARLRDIELAKAGQNNRRANILAALAIFIVIATLAVTIWTSPLDEYAKGIITLVMGRALGWVEQVFSFEFGTTRASKTKDDTISKLSGSN